MDGRLKIDKVYSYFTTGIDILPDGREETIFYTVLDAYKIKRKGVELDVLVDYYKPIMGPMQLCYFVKGLGSKNMRVANMGEVKKKLSTCFENVSVTKNDRGDLSSPNFDTYKVDAYDTVMEEPFNAHDSSLSFGYVMPPNVVTEYLKIPDDEIDY